MRGIALGLQLPEDTFSGQAAGDPYWVSEAAAAPRVSRLCCRQCWQSCGLLFAFSDCARPPPEAWALRVRASSSVAGVQVTRVIHYPPLAHGSRFEETGARAAEVGGRRLNGCAVSSCS